MTNKAAICIYRPDSIKDRNPRSIMLHQSTMFAYGYQLPPGTVSCCPSYVIFSESCVRDSSLESRHRHERMNHYNLQVLGSPPSYHILNMDPTEFWRLNFCSSTNSAVLNLRPPVLTNSYENPGINPQSENNVILRLRGLPFNCTAEQVLTFFGVDCPVYCGEKGVLIIKRFDGKNKGTAFVMFANEALAQKAQQKHRDMIDDRYIEVFPSNMAEVKKEIGMDMQLPSLYRYLPSTPSTSSYTTAYEALQRPPFHHPEQNVPKLPTSHAMLTAFQRYSNGLPALQNSSMMTFEGRKTCVRLRGMPYEAGAQHVKSFLCDYTKHIRTGGIHLFFNKQGLPIGEAIVEMDTEAAALSAARRKNNKYMECGRKRRYIEVYACTAKDVQLINTFEACTCYQTPTPPMSAYQPSPPLPPLPSPQLSVHIPNVNYYNQPQPSSRGAVIVRGLHSSATKNDVIALFRPKQICSECITFQNLAPGISHVMIVFPTYAEAIRAVQEKSRDITGIDVDMFAITLPPIQPQLY